MLLQSNVHLTIQLCCKKKIFWFFRPPPKKKGMPRYKKRIITQTKKKPATKTLPTIENNIFKNSAYLKMCKAEKE